MQTILKLLLIYFLLGFNLAKSDGHSSNENWSFYTGTFDFSDEGLIIEKYEKGRAIGD